MKPLPPKALSWFIALIAGILGIVAHFTHIPYVTEYHFWFVAGAFVLLILGTTFKGI